MLFLKSFFKEKNTHRKAANTTASALGSSWDELGKTTVSWVQTAFFSSPLNLWVLLLKLGSSH